jgi:TRAP-type uncharacterized transport system fused permease subunit
MTLNMGRTDRTFRLIAAVVLLFLVFFVTDGVLDWVLGIVAVVFIVTAFIGWCPAYLPFGLSTRRPS